MRYAANFQQRAQALLVGTTPRGQACGSNLHKARAKPAQKPAPIFKPSKFKDRLLALSEFEASGQPIARKIRNVPLQWRFQPVAVLIQILVAQGSFNSELLAMSCNWLSCCSSIQMIRLRVILATSKRVSKWQQQTASSGAHHRKSQGKTWRSAVRVNAKVVCGPDRSGGRRCFATNDLACPNRFSTRTMTRPFRTDGGTRGYSHSARRSLVGSAAIH